MTETVAQTQLTVNAEQIDSGRFVGRWRAHHGNFRCDWVLRIDGTCTTEIFQGKRLVSRPTGKWKIERGHLVSWCLDDDRGDTVSRFPDADRVLELADDYFVLSTSTGVRRYELVPDESSSTA